MTTNRRQFFRLMAGAGSALSLGAMTCLFESRACAAGGERTSTKTPDGLWSVSRTSWALGSDVTMTAIHERETIAAAAIEAAFGELELVESLMSIYRPGSQLSELNRRAVLARPHPYFVEVLKAAAAMSRMSGGAFDITVQPLWTLYSAAKKNGKLPDDESVTAAAARVDWRRVELAGDRVTLRGDGTAITLNGIAQGFAADRATAALQAHGVQHALIDTGECRTLGNKTGGAPWSVGIQHPRREDAFIAIADLNGRCLATSGDYATSFSDDHRFNHLFDPRTGRSPDELASVSIVADSAMQADALSTAVFVMGVDDGMKLVGQTPGADAFLVLKDGKAMMSRGFPLRQNE